MPAELLLRIRDAENSIKHELRTDWQGIDDKVGLLETVRIHCLHFTLRDKHKQEYRQNFDDPEQDALYFHMDFKEHDKLPVGPKESGDWLYAGNILGVTVLTIYVWSRAIVSVHDRLSA